MCCISTVLAVLFTNPQSFPGIVFLLLEGIQQRATLSDADLCDDGWRIELPEQLPGCFSEK